MMLIQSDNAFRSIYYEYYDGLLYPNILRQELLGQLKYLSLIRKNNEMKNWGLKISGISINDSFSNHRRLLLTPKILDSLNKINADFFIVNIDKLREIDEENERTTSYEDLLDITQGHDFMYLFSAFCRKKRGRAASDKEIIASLRCAYQISDFKSSQLYSDLTTYETAHTLRIVS